jgi:hypothetical protein
MYSPHTIQGDIVVNNFLTSCYTRGFPPELGRAVLKPLAAAYKLRFPAALLMQGNELLLHGAERVRDLAPVNFPVVIEAVVELMRVATNSSFARKLFGVEQGRTEL